MDRATVYRYLDGRHPDRPSERYLAALAYGFDLTITKVRAAANVPPGELGPWDPPIESGRLSKPVREALNALIVTLAKEGNDRGTSVEKIDEFGGDATIDFDVPATTQPRRKGGAAKGK